ncbi:MAG: Crp/Fnr family transcriptional regulator [Chloroflexi bacterium]|nr:MAG: Crp/Fnr family transcriptional regulator [Chloroflexota bacterium]
MPIHRPSHVPSPKTIEKFRQNAIESQVSIPESEWEYLVPHLLECRFEKNDYLISAGDVAKNFYFIIEGLVRFFYSTEAGKEFNKHFAIENGFAGSFHSLVLGAPCGFFVQALEETNTLVLPNQLLHELYERHSCWERLGRRNAENLVLHKEAREKEFLLDTLETRYRRFLREYPGLMDRIPQYHIASFLGVTNVALSRIRRKINQG